MPSMRKEIVSIETRSSGKISFPHGMSNGRVAISFNPIFAFLLT